MRCCSDHVHPIPSKVDRLANITTASRSKPWWIRNELCLDIVWLGLIVIVSIISRTTPYKKTVFITVSAMRGKFVAPESIGETFFQEILEERYKGRILDPTHPTRIRVETIFDKIINACNVGYKSEDDKRMTVSGDLKIGNHIIRTNNDVIQMVMRKEVFSRLNFTYTPSNLKLAVVESEISMAEYIVLSNLVLVTTKLLDMHCQSDADIAFILGHEVGHSLRSALWSELYMFFLLHHEVLQVRERRVA